MTRQTDPTAATTAAAIRRLRTGRGWSTRDLAERLTAAGYDFNNAGVSRWENGTRRVTVTELMVLATVFNVPPIALLLPMPDDPNELVELPGGSVPAADAWQWAMGEIPLGPVQKITRSEMWRFVTEGVPVFRREVPPVSKRNTSPGKGV
ncbi:helix-turn-helix domain-containing protein [Streptomyces virginiae]|uniref:helix-turn-helix domain-containing protein n=1 Tax=Streptomyces virginiae TaxID=1961 RepID=UPI0037A2019E